MTELKEEHATQESNKNCPFIGGAGISTKNIES